MSRRLFAGAAAAAFLGAVLVLSEVAVRLNVVSPAAFAAPSEVFAAIPRLVTRGFATDLALTTYRVVAGVLLGFPFGVAAAMLIYAGGPSGRPYGEAALDFIRSIPITALIPFFLTIYGIGEANKIAIAATASALTTAITVWFGIKLSLEHYALLLHLYRPNGLKRMRLVILPASAPEFAAALRLSVSGALVLVVVAEMFLGTHRGVGRVINDMSYSDDRAAQFAAIIAAGVLGFLLNRVCEFARRVVVAGLHLEGVQGGRAPR